jgi:POT family proton-dependent oligopeptide transporter
LGDRGLPPNEHALKKPLFAFINTEHIIYLLTLVVIPLVVTLFNFYAVMDYIMLGLGAVSLVYILVIGFKLDRVEKFKLYAALVMIIFSILFWSFYEQNSGSLNLFAVRNVDMNVFGINLPALSVNNFLPPGWVVLLSFFFAWLWPWLNKKGREPSTPLKFALSFILLGIGFYIFYLGCKSSTATGLIPLLTFIAGYFFIICGELCISPIGLSMITKLSPVKIVAMMMGIWFFASAIGEFLAQKIGSLMSVPQAVADSNEPRLTLPYYADIINNIGIGSIALGVLLIFFVPVLRKWMGGVR